MSWEDVERSFDGARAEDILIHLDLERFGELVGRVASTTHRLNGLEQFDPNTEEGHRLVLDAWRYVCHMADRAEFARSVQADLKKLDAPQSDTQGSVTQEGGTHLPEFGGAAPLGWEPPA